MRFSMLGWTVVLLLVAAVNTPAADVRMTRTAQGGVEISLGDQSIATYVPGDAQTHRPYFQNLRTPSGIQVTRHHPPSGNDPTDHADLHPGLWLGFADIGGRDFWRNKGPKVVNENLTIAADGKGSFEVVNRYIDGSDTLLVEHTKYLVTPLPAGYLLVVDTRLDPQTDGLWMGNEEEMGLGVRVATPLAVKSGKGGSITNSAGDVNEKGTWGKPADWCDLSGTIDGKPVGVALFSDRNNPNKTWFHSRDYGYAVVNNFGEHAGAPVKMPLTKDKPLHLRYGVFVHEGEKVDVAGEYKRFGTPASAAASAPLPPGFEKGKTQPAPPEPAGMVALFDGKTLTNWNGDPRLWSVKDGVIRGETTQENPANGNTFCFWTGGTVKDFELRCSFRIGGTNNSGVQYRSKHLDPAKEKNKWVAQGYQAEVRVDAETPGFIYDERGGRGRMCLVGEQAVWEDGAKQRTVTGSVGDPAAIRAALKVDGWNDYVITAKGNHVQHYINGVQTIDFTDNDKQRALTEGVVALQLHAGKPMWVEFRDIRLKQYE